LTDFQKDAVSSFYTLAATNADDTPVSQAMLVSDCFLGSAALVSDCFLGSAALVSDGFYSFGSVELIHSEERKAANQMQSSLLLRESCSSCIGVFPAASENRRVAVVRGATHVRCLSATNIGKLKLRSALILEALGCLCNELSWNLGRRLRSSAAAPRGPRAILLGRCLGLMMRDHNLALFKIKATTKNN
jgi:hypothetical protein